MRLPLKLAVALTAAAALASVSARGAAAVTFSPAVPTGRALSQLAASERALVGLRPGSRAERLVRSRGGRRVSDRLGIWSLPGRDAARLLPALERLGALRYAEPSRRRDSFVRFTDPLATPELGYHLYAVGADRAEPPGPGFPITLIDSGIDLTNPDFSTRPDTISLDTQFVSGPTGDDYHGTEVATAAAAATNGVGAEGVYPQALLRTYDLPDLSDESIIAGIEVSLLAGPSVINLSLGGPDSSRALYEATQLAVGRGSLVVAASGNELDQGNPVSYPAAYPHVLTVGATDTSGLPAEFSSASRAVDVAAPGVDIPVQHPTDPELYEQVTGTSFSAPIVSAAAAWVRTARGSMTVTQLADLIRLTARDIGEPGYDQRTGFGLLDIPAALAAPLPTLDPLEPNDDVAQVVAGGLFPAAKRLVSGRFTASVDDVEDPGDVYRVSVPAGRKLTVKVTSDDDVAVALFGPTARTVVGSRARVAATDRAGKQLETVVYTNRTRKAMVLFLDVSPGRARTVTNPEYTVTIATARAPR